MEDVKEWVRVSMPKVRRGYNTRNSLGKADERLKVYLEVRSMGLFDTTSFRIVEQGLSILWHKGQVIQENIANADTPDYNCKYLTFSGVLNDKMRANGTIKKELNLQEGLYIDYYTNDQADHNNVDSDTQQAEYLKVQYRIDALINQMNGDFSRIRSAMSTK